MKKFIAASTTALLAVGLALVAVAAPASAHTGAVTGSASCQTDGTYTVTWTYHQTNTPSSGNGSQADVKVITNEPSGTLINGQSGQWWLNATADHASSNGQTAIPTRTGNFDQTFTQTKIAGTTKTAKVQVQTDWLGWGSADNWGTVTMDGSCTVPTPKDAAAAVSTTEPTCSAPGTLVLGTATNATWGTVTHPNGALSYLVTATAADKHLFSDGTTTKKFDGTLKAQLAADDAACKPAPKCIPTSAVSYTYAPSTNSGVITVRDVENSTGELCQPFYVTATSWKFTKDNNVWPQTLDQVQYLDPISKVGTYQYQAKVTCGQGDIYASFVSQPKPTSTLTGPGTPFEEHFLHSMGFTGPTPTYVQQDPSCLTKAPTTATPTFETASCTDGSRNWVILPAVTGGIWSATTAGKTTSLAAGKGYAGAPVAFGEGTYVLTDADAHDAYDVKGGPWTYTPLDISTVDCRTEVTPVAPTATAITECGVYGSVSVPADTAQIDYTVTGQGNQGTYVVTAEPIGKVKFAVGSYPDGGWVFNLGTYTECLKVTPGDPKVTEQTCQSGILVGGSITVALDDHLVYTLTGGPSNLNISPVTAPVTDLLPGTYTIAVAPTAGYVLDGAAKWPLEIPVTAAGDCETVQTSASFVQAACTDGTGDGGLPTDLDAAADSSTLVPATITVGLNDNLVYTLDGQVVTEATTTVKPGDHTISVALTPAAAAAGFGLIPLDISTFTVDDIDCTIDTLPAFPAAVTGTAQECAATTGTDSGYITVGDDITPDANVHVKYRIVGEGTDITVKGTLAAKKVKVAPGHYTVTASAIDPADTIDGQSVFRIAIDRVATVCGDLKTLALTGGTAGLGLVLAGAMLFLGIAGIYMRRRFGRSAE